MQPGNSDGGTQDGKGVENKGHSDSAGACHGPVGHDNEGTKPYGPWHGDHSLESTMGRSSRVHQLLRVPGWEELPSLCLDSVILKQSSPVETCCP